MRRTGSQSLRLARRWLAYSLVPAVCCILVSCIDGREEFWLASDGSGRAQIRYSMPASMARTCGGEQGLRELLDEFIRQTPSLTHATRRVSCEDGRMVVDFRAAFTSAADLIAALRGDTALTSGKLQSVVAPLIGQFHFRRSGLTVNLTRTVQPAKALPGAFFMPAAQFDGRRLEYIMHLPMVADESNATRTEDGGRTLIWDQTLQDGLKNSVVIHFKGIVPVPWWLLAAAATALLALGWLGLKMRRQRRARISEHLTATGVIPS
ncbi:MAG: hypothetical protein DVB25_08140 [Verrucomicrobia bacterium]|nr:MAG: hypothetical protein DVB25_08140 [Verrucomicrobiota bacterium]